MNSKSIKILFLVALLAVNIGLSAQQDSLDFPAPQYMLPFYDNFSYNMLNVAAMGRGFTTQAMLGSGENAVNNPATLVSEKARIYMELTIKPPVREADKYFVAEDTISIRERQYYASPIPFGMIGISGRFYKGLHGAISYNVPKSLVYDNFAIETMQGNDEIIRYPAYYLHQFTTTVAGSIGDFRLGLNLQQQIHHFKDILVIYSFDRIDKAFYVFRVQPGVFYKKGSFRFGASFMPESQKKMDIRYRVYNVKLPMKFAAGMAYLFNSNGLFLETEWEQFSRMSSAFEDRLTLKAGIEKRVRNITYRAGVVSAPGVFEGAYKLPVYETENPGATYNWQAISQGAYLDKSDQLFVTIGFTHYFKGGELTLGLGKDFMSDVPVTQFASALSFNLETLKGKKKPILID